MEINRTEAVQLIAKLAGSNAKYCGQIYYKDWKMGGVNLSLEFYALPMTRKHQLICGMVYLDNLKYTCKNAWNIFAIMH
jgi:hypothetical protein